MLSCYVFEFSLLAVCYFWVWFTLHELMAFIRSLEEKDIWGSWQQAIRIEVDFLCDCLFCARLGRG